MPLASVSHDHEISFAAVEGIASRGSWSLIVAKRFSSRLLIFFFDILDDLLSKKTVLQRRTTLGGVIDDRLPGNGAFTQFSIYFDDGFEDTVREGGAQMIGQWAMNAVALIEQGEQKPVPELGISFGTDLTDRCHHVAQGEDRIILCLSGQDEQIWSDQCIGGERA